MYQYIRRRGASRDNKDTRWGGWPEVQPGQSVQAILNTANRQGGDTIFLGPYTFYFRSTLTVPSYVTVRGVPNRTKLVILFDPDDPQYGPVVALNAYSRLQDCIVDFDLTQEGSITGYSFAQDTAAFTTPSGTSTLSSTDYNSVVRLDGSRARVQDCRIPAGVRRAVVVTANRGMMIGNEISHDTTNASAAIYLNDDIEQCVISSNLCTSTATGAASDDGIISIEDGTYNVVSGNLATLVERT